MKKFFLFFLMSSIYTLSTVFAIIPVALISLPLLPFLVLGAAVTLPVALFISPQRVLNSIEEKQNFSIKKEPIPFRRKDSFIFSHNFRDKVSA